MHVSLCNFLITLLLYWISLWPRITYILNLENVIFVFFNLGTIINFSVSVLLQKYWSSKYFFKNLKILMINDYKIEEFKL